MEVQKQLKTWLKSSFDNDFVTSSSRKDCRKSEYQKDEALAKTKRKKGIQSQLLFGERGGNNCVGESWIELFAPQAKEDLAVNKKKVEQIETWLIDSLSRCKNFLTTIKCAPIALLTGPAGCGKTASIKVLAKVLDLDMKEWVNPVDNSSGLFDDGFSNNRLLVSATTQKEQFVDFILRANKYSSLFVKSTSGRLIVVEDFPNVFLREPEVFHNVLQLYSKTGRCPAVFIVSESGSGSSIEHHLFPKSLLAELDIMQVSFNPIAPTSLTKAVSRICGIAKVTLSKSENESLVAASNGDVRHLINLIQFFVKPGSTSRISKECKSNSFAGQKRKKNMVESSSSILGERDHSLFLFHALGKILYCKRDSGKEPEGQLPIHLKDKERMVLLSNAEAVFSRTAVTADTFTLFLHHNYLSFVNSAYITEKCCTSFSDANIICTEWSGKEVLDEYSASVVARSLMFHLEEDKLGGGQFWRPFYKPEWFSVLKLYRDGQAAVRNCFKEWAYTLDLQTQIIPYLGVVQPSADNAQLEIIKKYGRFSSGAVRPKTPGFHLSEKEIFEEFDTHSTVPVADPNPRVEDTVNMCESVVPQEDYIIEEYDD
ncbi:cell cycle checkpoint protein RAD17-like [Limulus polyphemus]|uniref:Cell cycle checkpoint protein RAD17-like n=1 Tax=Limulus polyphemus TaxID=6850 RepID=A0ABM1BJH0_LIMPO|nr:cell cycle checkpoint protein RAD17-like [Limulus polyphemus]